MNTQRLFYLCASCYDNVTNMYSFVFYVWAPVGLRVFARTQSLPHSFLSSARYISPEVGREKKKILTTHIGARID